MSITYFEAFFGDTAPMMAWVLHGVTFASTVHLSYRVFIAKDLTRPLYLRILDQIIAVGHLFSNLPLSASSLPWAWAIVLVSMQSFSIFTFFFVEFDRFLRACKQALVDEIVNKLLVEIKAQVSEQERSRMQQPTERHDRV